MTTPALEQVNTTAIAVAHMAGIEAVLPSLHAFAQAWQGLADRDLDQLGENHPALIVALKPLADAAASLDLGGIPVANAPGIPRSGASLTAALDLADTVAPVPAHAHVALQILRQALADALCIDVDQLRRQSVGSAVDPQA